MALACRWRSRPQHQNRTHAPQQTETLFDHLVGRDLQGQRDLDAERLGGLKVDDQVVLGQRLNWQVGRLRAGFICNESFLGILQRQ
jgi:hypothetical protein